MKIHDLQERLSKLNPELEVVCYSEDENLLNKKTDRICLDVLDVKAVSVKRYRLKDGSPCLKFEQGSDSSLIALLEVTTDF
jgi:spore coat polysaccharide biosynthesis predicted glycosyltransferase SpsG